MIKTCVGCHAAYLNEGEEPEPLDRFPPDYLHDEALELHEEPDDSEAPP